MGVSKEESERQLAELRAKDRAKADQKASDRARDASDAKGNAWRQRPYDRMDGDEQERARALRDRAKVLHGYPDDAVWDDRHDTRIARIKVPPSRTKVEVAIPPTNEDVRALFDEIRRSEFPDLPPFDCFTPINPHGEANEDPAKDHRISPYWGAVTWAARQPGPKRKTEFEEGVRQVIANLPNPA